MARKYKPKSKGYVIPYLYVDGNIRLLLGMERLKAPGEFYCNLLGGTTKSKRTLEICTMRELAEETGGYLQMDQSKLIEFDSYSDKDRVTVYLLPLQNTEALVHDINSFREGLDIVSPECAENSFIVAASLDDLEKWDQDTRVGPLIPTKPHVESTKEGIRFRDQGPERSLQCGVYRTSSEPYHYFRKPYVNRQPLQSYKNFNAANTSTNTGLSVWLSDRLSRVLSQLREEFWLTTLHDWHRKNAHFYICQDLGLCDCSRKTPKGTKTKTKTKPKTNPRPRSDSI